MTDPPTARPKRQCAHAPPICPGESTTSLAHLIATHQVRYTRPVQHHRASARRVGREALAGRCPWGPPSSWAWTMSELINYDWWNKLFSVNFWGWRRKNLVVGGWPQLLVNRTPGIFQFGDKFLLRGWSFFWRNIWVSCDLASTLKCACRCCPRAHKQALWSYIKFCNKFKFITLGTWNGRVFLALSFNFFQPFCSS